MPKCKLTFPNGKEIEVELSDEFLQAYGAESPYKVKDRYYHIDVFGKVNESTYLGDRTEMDLVNCGNHYGSKKFATDEARAERLLRILKRFSIEENIETKDNWMTSVEDCRLFYIIGYDPETKFLRAIRHPEINIRYTSQSIIFKTEDIAEKAIKKYNEELLWYFTEYLPKFLNY